MVLEQEFALAIYASLIECQFLHQLEVRRAGQARRAGFGKGE